jgi:uncharacterized membrane protein required for colicin V production
MSLRDWIIVIGAFTLIALLGIWRTLTSIGSYLSHRFPATVLEQVGNVLSATGNAALGAFVMVIVVAMIVIAVILYIMGKTNPSY